VGLGVGLGAVKMRKICTAWNRTRAVQPVARRYTDRAIPTPATGIKHYATRPAVPARQGRSLWVCRTRAKFGGKPSWKISSRPHPRHI
jgi:hypothetical protein